MYAIQYKTKTDLSLHYETFIHKWTPLLNQAGNIYKTSTSHFDNILEICLKREYKFTK